MSINKVTNDGKSILFDELPEHKKRLVTFVDSLRGDCDFSYLGMEKAMSIRLDASNYPKVKAMANISNNSLNVIINDLLGIALGYVNENLSDEDSAKLNNEQSIVWAEWLEEVKKKEGK